MPQAVTHVLLVIIIVDLFRDYILRHKKYVTLHTILIAGIAGLLPDVDVPLSWALNYFGYSFELLEHGGITHTAFFGLIFLIPGYYFLKNKKHKLAGYFFVISFGILLHILLDYLLGGGAWEGVMWLWPISTQAYKLHLLSKTNLLNIPGALDAIILILWLWHEEKKHKIRDFI